MPCINESIEMPITETYKDSESQDNNINLSTNESDNQQRHIDGHCREDPDRTIKYTDIHGPDSARKTYGLATKIYRKYLEASELQPWNPWYPSKTYQDFITAQWFITSRISKKQISKYLEDGLDSYLTTSFDSGEQLWNLLENTDFGLGCDSWSQTTINIEGKEMGTVFFSRYH
jgi:hypothetical protein